MPAQPKTDAKVVAEIESSPPIGGYLTVALGGGNWSGAYFGIQAKANADTATKLELGSHQAGADAQGQALMANILYGGAVGLTTALSG